MGNRHRGRELAFQMLFQVDMGGQKLDDVTGRFLEEEKGLPKVKEFAKVLAQGALEHLAELDSVIAKPAHNWDLKRFSGTDRALLRLGAYELLYREDIPIEVTLDEYVELAKEYGGDDSPRFVNGILDEVRRGHPRGKTEPVKPVPRGK